MTELIDLGFTLDNDGIIDVGNYRLIVYAPNNALILPRTLNGIHSSGGITIDVFSIVRIPGDDQDFTLRTSRNLIFNIGNIGTVFGTAFILTAGHGAGTGYFSYQQNLFIVLGSITLTTDAAAPVANADLFFRSVRGNVTINAELNTGSGAIVIKVVNITIDAKLNTESGDLTLTAGSGEDTTGTISFAINPTLAADTIELEQDGAVFPNTQPAVTFSIVPELIYSGTGVQVPVPWQSSS